MTAVHVSTQSPLLDRFDEFYREVILIREDILKREEMEGPLSPEPDKVAERLVTILDRQMSGLKNTKLSASQLREAHYAMVGLADEIFLGIQWPGRASWLDFLLEERIFQSQGAGKRIYKKIDAMLARNDPEDIELARVYLMVLALGFRGRFGGQADTRGPHEYLRNLYYFIFKREPRFEHPETRLFPQAYQATLDKDVVVDRPRSSRWLWLGLLVLVGYVVVTQVFWYNISSGLSSIVDQILKLAGS